ncbi:ribonuclease H-like domain-containing protein [Dyella ginsengisoli]|uniref:ribonuclease H-like domain-containing protein n=1 Tax=Dyella ginsengisoli TaxID=363848 RepID=UPI000348C7DD|nr:ribonuclease H-like domain-containing protein [Dyella ginsengisoli]
MSALRDRLRGLRAQAGQSVAAAAPAPAPRQTTIEDLRWLLGVRARSRARPTTPFPARDRELFGEEIAPGLRYTEEHVDWPGPPAPIDTRFARREEMIDPARLLHFDTETTGLAGGTGTRAFMIGAADWCGGRLRLRQLTITTMAAEPAMLRTFAEWLAPDSVLVSYNGKCYDAPLLATRYRLARLANPLAGLDHLDLLHPVRRHWKGQWENCRLATAERQLLGVLREDDLPGSEAPAAWLTYLRGGPATNLRRVAAHNAQDLKSLAGVLLRLSALGGVAAREPS